MKIPIIAGPTASGKTALGVALAKKYNGEIISCDSMQIFKDIPICSAQPTEEEKEGILHHLMGFLDFDARFTVEDYRTLALEKIREVQSRGKLPIIVGGTGMYLHYLIYQPDFGADSDEKIKCELEKLSNEQLYAKLTELDSAPIITPNDRKRLVRALEVYALTGKLPPKTPEKIKNTEFDFELYCISPDREILYEKINRRVDIMLENGMVDEVKRMQELGANESHQSFKAIGCRQLIDHFNGKCSFEEAVETIKQESRRYAKRQLTWMRKEDATWLENGSDIDNFFG